MHARTLAFGLLLALSLPLSASAQILRVGRAEMYTTIAAAAAAATDGATVEITAGTYTEEIVWTQSNLTIRGVGGPVILDRTGMPVVNQGGKGIFIIDGADVTIEGLTFTGATCSSDNAAGIRWQGGGMLTVRDCVFHDNQDGILGGNHADNVALIEGCEFYGNGLGQFGYTHNLYINEIDTLTFRGNYSHTLAAGTPDIGHLFKSRAHHNYVLYNRLTAEGSHSSYELQLPEGGIAYVIGNLIEQGSMGPNRTIISIGGDGMQWPSPHVFIVNNTIVNDDTGGTFVNAATPDIMLDVVNNLMIGPGMAISGGNVVRMANNVMGATDSLVSASTFDYHLVMGSPAVEGGTDPGADGTMSLLPMFQYVHPHALEARTTVGVIDVGAYELGNVAAVDAGSATDAGSGTDAGSATDSGSTTHDGGSAATDAGHAPTTNGGCCRVAGARSASGSTMVAGLALLALMVRRRRSVGNGR